MNVPGKYKFKSPVHNVWDALLGRVSNMLLEKAFKYLQKQAASH